MRAKEFTKPKFKIDKKKNSLSVTLVLDNKVIGQYQYDNNTNRHTAEVIPEYKGKGYGKLLLLKALEVANDLGFEFVEDESRTSEYDNLVDSLENSGYVVRDDDQIYLTQNGLDYLHSQTKDFTNEAPLPPDWDPEQLNLRQTFKNRLKYALDRAKRLGGGSSRVAMTIDYEGRPTALKVAKNLKGLAQNEAEIEILEDFYVGQLPIVIPLIDYDKANKRPVWLQTEIAKKVQAPTLMKMLHTPSMYLLTNQVRNITGDRKPHEMDDAKLKKVYFETHNNLWKPTEEDFKIFRQYAEELAELVSSSTLETGDLQNPANWGVYNGRPVVIDLGFTGETKGLYGYKE